MKTLYLAFALSAVCTFAHAADPRAPDRTAPARPTSVTADCRSLEGSALKECLKVAKQMDQSARTGKAPPSETRPAPLGKTASQRDAKRALGEVHSSPIMQTPEEKAEADATRAGKDPRKAVEAAREKTAPNP